MTADIPYLTHMSEATMQIVEPPVEEEPKCPTPHVELMSRDALEVIRTIAMRIAYRGGGASPEEAQRILEVLPIAERGLK